MLDDDRDPETRGEPRALMRLAAAYHAEAMARIPSMQRDRLAAAPVRLGALNAIELYLVAFLRARQVSSREIRGWRHDLSRHAERAAALGLVLRRRTLNHLIAIAHTHEYRALRHHPENVVPVPANRLAATLEELGRKVAHALAAPPARAAAAPPRRPCAIAAPRPAPLRPPPSAVGRSPTH
jgi:hypothetical protein